MKRHLLMLLPVAALTATFSGCSGEPEWVAVYEDCKSSVSKAAAEMKSENSSTGEQHPMAEAMEGMVISMGMAACESIKQVCENDPDGDACQAVIAESKKNSDR
jgi:beta-lactam-binding protein with PASTA domain